MRVALDVTSARRASGEAGETYSGTTVYLQRLVPALRRLGVEVLEVHNERRAPPAGGGWGSVRNLAADLAWTQHELPRRAARAGADVLHHPLPACAHLAGQAQVTTVQDLAFEALPWAFDPRFRRWARLTHRAAARGAQAVVAISAATRDDVVARWGVDSERIVVAPLGPGQEPDARVPVARPTHFLYVGDAEPRKNLGLLLEAHARYRASVGERTALPLVLAGSAQARGRGITVEQRPGPERLAQLYARAAALVHPSLHEGFGLTPLEAMSAGAPVVAVRARAVEEVCADAALYVGPRDAEGLAGHLVRLGVDLRLRADLRLRGRRRAAEFSWARCASAHRRAYTLALQRAAGRKDLA
ncbi:MAG TPA: glycosyltransferase family 1 protein [Solirubrobacteraceae bacterium]|nr:glycosyltransferase family 1 protein [Solirubrobacteraceae bacterium]